MNKSTITIEQDVAIDHHHLETMHSSCESFMREPFSRIAELEKQVAFLTGELQAAIATIEKVREIMRTEPGYDVEDHARVLRMMADAFAKLQQ